jgi:hypothetical protein
MKRRFFWSVAPWGIALRVGVFVAVWALASAVHDHSDIVALCCSGVNL